MKKLLKKQADTSKVKLAAMITAVDIQEVIAKADEFFAAHPPAENPGMVQNHFNIVSLSFRKNTAGEIEESLLEPVESWKDAAWVIRPLTDNVACPYRKWDDYFRCFTKKDKSGLPRKIAVYKNRRTEESQMIVVRSGYEIKSYFHSFKSAPLTRYLEIRALSLP
jgi:hypothetical protein